MIVVSFSKTIVHWLIIGNYKGNLGFFHFFFKLHSLFVIILKCFTIVILVFIEYYFRINSACGPIHHKGWIYVVACQRYFEEYGKKKRGHLLKNQKKCFFSILGFLLWFYLSLLFYQIYKIYLKNNCPTFYLACALRSIVNLSIGFNKRELYLHPINQSDGVGVYPSSKIRVGIFSRNNQSISNT